MDAHVSNNGGSLLTTASENRLFLKHDHLQTWSEKSEADLKSIADVATALLIGLPDGPALHSIDHVLSLGSAVDNETFFANLVHLIMSIRKAAMDAIVRSLLEAIQISLLRWYQFWFHKHSIDDWFAEWPNGQRPLSTTWPWNIKPALLVLWGVCWMFYYDNGGRWCADNIGGAGNSAPNIMHGQGAQAATISQPRRARKSKSSNGQHTSPANFVKQKVFCPGGTQLLIRITHGCRQTHLTRGALVMVTHTRTREVT